MVSQNDSSALIAKVLASDKMAALMMADPLAKTSFIGVYARDKLPYPATLICNTDPAINQGGILGVHVLRPQWSRGLLRPARTTSTVQGTGELSEQISKMLQL